MLLWSPNEFYFYMMCLQNGKCVSHVGGVEKIFYSCDDGKECNVDSWQCWRIHHVCEVFLGSFILEKYAH